MVCGQAEDEPGGWKGYSGFCLLLMPLGAVSKPQHPETCLLVEVQALAQFGAVLVPVCTQNTSEHLGWGGGAGISLFRGHHIILKKGRITSGHTIIVTINNFYVVGYHETYLQLIHVSL